MGRGDRTADQKIGTLLLFRQQRSVGDRIGTTGRDFDIPFVLHTPVTCNVALHIVRVHLVRTKTDWIICDSQPPAVVLCHHILTNKSPVFTYIDLGGPATVIRKFISCQPPFAHLISYICKYPGMVCESPHQTFLIVLLPLDDLFTRLIISIRIPVIDADLVE